VVSLIPRPLYPRGKTLSTNSIEGWVGPRVEIDVVANRKILPFQESNPGRPARSLVTVLRPVNINDYLAYQILLASSPQANEHFKP
jgi:hypothetical protein